MQIPENLHIVAAGYGTRLRPEMDRMGLDPNYPKHLLPTGNPGDETILGRIVKQSRTVVEDPTIHANESNFAPIVCAPDITNPVNVVLEKPHPWGHFGPFIDTLVSNEVRVLGCGGDHYLDSPAWQDLIEHHDSSQFPVTFTAARGTPVAGGLVHSVRNGQIQSFRRKPTTEAEDMVNIGLYVFDADSVVLESLKKLSIERFTGNIAVTTERIAGQLVADGLVGVFELPPGSALNINTPEIYRNLLLHTRERSVSQV